MIKKLVPSLALVLALTLGLSSCATSNVKESKFESELQSKTKLTKTQAQCVGSKTYKAFSQKEINKLYTANNSKDLPAGVETKFESIISTCIS